MDKITPDKFFYKIGEVAEITQIEAYVLRYWESEFHFKLTKTKNNQRLYQKKDIQRIFDIKTLLYEEKYTIAGAKKQIKVVNKQRREKEKESKSKNKNQLGLLSNVKSFASDREVVQKLQTEIKEVYSLLDQDPNDLVSKSLLPRT